MQRKLQPSEKGQVMVLLVVGMVALLGFTALAIDGGMIYSERRHAQNAADAAALAGALQKANNRTEADVIQAALNSAAVNHYDGAQVTPSISGPHTDFNGKYYLVTVQVVSTVEPAFAHFVFDGPLQNTVTAVARVNLSQPPLAEYAIIALGNCVDQGGSLVGVTGGGVSGGVQAFQGGIFLNSPETSGDHCAVDPPNNGYGITAETVISSVGSYDYNGQTMISPQPIQTGVNGGARIGDPLYDVPEPQCTAGGGIVDGEFQPGNYSGSEIGAGAYAPGIYCIAGEMRLSGDDGITGDGVVFYFKNAGMQFTGQAGLTITAPTADNCLGTAGDPTASCTYQGIALFAARSNTSTLEVRGNGGSAVTGMIYTLNGTVQARGGGTSEGETSVIGQVIANQVQGDGNGSFTVTYVDSATYWKSPDLSLHE